MSLPDFYRPFDLTYELVTERINDYRATIKDASISEWIGRLVTGFHTERTKWPGTLLDAPIPGPHFHAAPSPYLPYMREACRIRWRFLRLAVCACLHISYDLPRVLADEWPDFGSRDSVRDETTGEDAYHDMAPIFERVLVSKSRDFAVVGILASLLHFVPSDAIQTISHGVMNLRRAAWNHGGRLYRQSPHRRATTEAAMLKAMTTALTHVSNSRPWTAGALTPPDRALRRREVSGLLAVGGLSERPELFVLPLAALFIAGSFFFSRVIHRRKETEVFLLEFTRRVQQYVEKAVASPEELDAYLRQQDPTRRREEPPQTSQGDYPTLEG